MPWRGWSLSAGLLLLELLGCLLPGKCVNDLGQLFEINFLTPFGTDPNLRLT